MISANISKGSSSGEHTDLLVYLPPLRPDALNVTLATLASVFTSGSVVVACPDATPRPPANSTLEVVSFAPAAPVANYWVHTAADFLNAYTLAKERGADAVLLLGAEPESLSAEAIESLATAVTLQRCDLAVPRYSLGPFEGMVNSGILYPLTRSLFGVSARFPLAVDIGVSLRMAERLATAAQKFTAAGNNDAILWPGAEAAVAGFTIQQIEVGTRAVPHPVGSDLNTVLGLIAASLFADVEAKAAFWQRSRPSQFGSAPATTAAVQDAAPPDVRGMIDTFRLAYVNLHSIWALVLPPNSLLGLKHLSLMPAETFHMPDELWARIVFDFVLAYRLRTLNRGHLLGALTPLYLAWVASFVMAVREGADPETRLEEIETAFESDKPYLVSRWRWPDRFNP